jgi:hypothetical protein
LKNAASGAIRYDLQDTFFYSSPFLSFPFLRRRTTKAGIRTEVMSLQNTKVNFLHRNQLRYRKFNKQINGLIAK